MLNSFSFIMAKNKNKIIFGFSGRGSKFLTPDILD